jgi:Zn-dependent metalloprotease
MIALLRIGMGNPCLKVCLLLLFVALPVFNAIVPPQPVYADSSPENTAPVIRTFWHDAAKSSGLLKSDRVSAAGLGLTAAVTEHPDAIAKAFVQSCKADLGMDESTGQWDILKTESDSLGMSHVRMQQRFNGLEVFGSQIIVHIANDKVNAVNGQYTSSMQLSTKPKIDLDTAYKTTVEQLKFTRPVLTSSSLVIFNPAMLDSEKRSTNHLAYKLIIEDQAIRDSFTVFVEAGTGKELLKYSTRPTARNREVYDLNGTINPTQQYNEIGPIGAPCADATSAWTFTGNVYNYYLSTFGRDSFDNAGATMKSYVRWGTLNAQWDTVAEDTTFGNGWALEDLVAHEWTHAVDQYSANLIYAWQPGALNEAMSDIFACMVDRDEWIIGDGLNSPLRYLNNPEFNRCPGKVSEYEVANWFSDYGEVHKNSTILGHGAYLMSDGGNYNGRTITGITRAYTEKIMYRALTAYMTNSTTFNDAYYCILAACSDLYGGTSSVTYANVRTALQAVELDLKVPGSIAADAYEPDDSKWVAPSITPNAAPTSHNFHTGGDEDWVKLKATAGTQYIIQTSNLGVNCNTELYLLDTDGTTVITSDDDSGGGLASKIAWTPTASGIYYVLVIDYWGDYGAGYTYSVGVTIIAPPAAPTLVSPTSGFTVLALTPNLAWNNPAGAVSYGVQVSTVSTFANTLVNQRGIVPSTYNVPVGANLAWGTTYYWRANATNLSGSTSRWSTARTFKTALGPAPNAPSNLIATAVSATQINLTWDDNSDNETGFKIERKKVGGTFAQVGTVAANVHTYNNTSGLTADTAYTYRVRANLGTTLNSDYSNEATVATLPLPPPAPTLVSPASGFTVPTLTPTLDWSEPTGAVSYGVQVSTASTFAILLVNEPSLGTSTYTLPSDLEWGRTYYWRANATNNFNSASKWSAARTFKTGPGPAPNVPSNLVATAASSTRIDLTWNDNSANEVGFKVERKKAGGAYALVATVGTDIHNYSNTTGLTANTTYTYRVRAYNFTSNYSAYCPDASDTTWPLPPAAPTLVSPPSGATGQSLTPTLDWNEPVGAGSYTVQVSTNSTFTGIVVNETVTGASNSNYTVTAGKLNPGTPYFWRVSATNGSGSASAWSAYRSFTTGL